MKDVTKKSVHVGFTLIELLIIIVIIAILLSITLIAINPSEQFNKTKDITTKNVAIDFIKANVGYFASYQAMPWEKNQNCQNEMQVGGTLADMPNCVHELTNGGKLEEAYRGAEELKNIYATACGTSSVVCYKPSSKTEIQNATYTKFGVNNPGCPGNSSDPDGCYWCKPVIDNPACVITPTPTDTPVPTSIPTPSPTPSPLPDIVPGYKIDETKFFQTYAVYFFDYPGFPPPAGGWNAHLSLRPDFGGNYTETIKTFGIPSSYSQDAPLSTSYAALRKITSKYVGFASIPYYYDLYKNGCGKTVYWRIANYYSESATDKKVGPTYTGVIDCTTKVGIVDPPLSWYTVFDQGGTNQQKQYDISWDFDKNGVIDWTDYWLGGFSTKIRYGGWAHPE